LNVAWLYRRDYSGARFTGIENGDRRIDVSEGAGARNERERQRRELEEAGWELVERGGGKIIWRNPRSGALYPQSVAITMVREGASPRMVDEEP
jgi:hypothetical protein